MDERRYKMGRQSVVMTSGKEIKFAARFAYLEAIEEHWPEVMSSLREGVFEEYRRCLPAMPNNELSDWRQLEAAWHTSLSGPLKAFVAALQKWMGEHRFRDEWILDAAVQRLCAWSHGNGIELCYRPRDLKTERFQPRFGIWMPVYTPWPQFKKEMDAIYRAESVRYRRKVNISWNGAPSRYLCPLDGSVAAGQKP